MITDMRELADSLVETGLADRDSIVGCTPDQVNEFRRVRGVAQLPEQYAEFLAVLGQGAGQLLRGTDFFYPAILQVGDWGQEVIDENEIGHLVVPGSLVLGTHQGYIVYWLEPGGLVHRYMEGEDTIEQTWQSLLEFLVYEAARIREILKPPS